MVNCAQSSVDTKYNPLKNNKKTYISTLIFKVLDKGLKNVWISAFGHFLFICTSNKTIIPSYYLATLSQKNLESCMYPYNVHLQLTYYSKNMSKSIYTKKGNFSILYQFDQDTRAYCLWDTAGRDRSPSDHRSPHGSRWRHSDTTNTRKSENTLCQIRN